MATGKRQDANLSEVLRTEHTVSATIRIVSIALDFLRRNDDPCPVFAPLSKQTRPNVLDFGRVAVLLVAASRNHAPTSAISEKRSQGAFLGRLRKIGEQREISFSAEVRGGGLRT